jgi:hypothetical protein
MGVGRAIATGVVTGTAVGGVHYLVSRLWAATVGIDTPAKIAGLGAVQLALGGATALGAWASARGGIPRDVSAAAASTAAGMSLATGGGLLILATRLHLARRSSAITAP